MTRPALLAAILLISAPAPAAEPENLVANGNFSDLGTRPGRRA